MPDDALDATVSYRLKQAETHIKDLEVKLEQVQKDAERKERQRLTWGLGVLGAVALYLFSKLAPPLRRLSLKRLPSNGPYCCR